MMKKLLFVLAFLTLPLGVSALVPLQTNQGGTGLDTIGTSNQILGVNGLGTGLEYKDPGGGDYHYVSNAGVYSMYAGQNITSLSDSSSTGSVVTGSYTLPQAFNLYNTILYGNDAGVNINAALNGTLSDVAIGNGALYSDVGSGDNVAIGTNALYYMQGGATNTAIGSSAGTGGASPITYAQQSFFLGQQTGQNAQPASYDSLGNIFIGAGSGVDTLASSITGSIVFGSQSFATDNFQFVLGGSSSAYNSITNGYFGSGVYVMPGFTPSDFTMHASGADITATDQNAANLSFAGGIATGSGQGGGFTWQTSDAGGSGTTQQTLSNKMELGVLGQLKLNLYGTGTFTGSPVRTLSVDSSGNVIETALASGGTVTDITQTQPSAGLTITGSGVPCTTSCSFTFALADDLAALEALSGTGIAVRTGTSTWINRSVAGTSNRISVSNGSGVAGNPTIDIDAAYVGQSSITTLGTIGTGVWQGTVVTGQYGGTGVNNNGKTITLAANLTTSGANALTLTTTGVTNVTLPTTGTLATLAGAESLTNKKLGSLTTNGFVKTSAGDGTLSVDTTTYLSGITIGTTALTSGTAGRILFEGAGNVIQESANMLWDNTNKQIQVDTTTGSATTPSFAVGSTNNGMYLAGSNQIGWSTSGTSRMTLNSSELNVSVDVTKGGFKAGGNNISTSQQIVAGVSNTNTQQYRTTNGGSDITINGIFSNALTAAGGQAVIMDKGNGNYLVFGAANGTRMIARAGIALTNLTNTAGSEQADLILSTQSAGAAMAERWRISSAGYLSNTGAVGTAALTLAAGTTAIAPLRLTSGTSLSSALAGAVEFTTDDLFFTITTGTARKNVTLWDTLGTSTRVPFATTNGRLTDDADMTFATDTLTVTKVSSGTVISTGVVRLKNYTVATLPAGTQGDTAYVTDALAPTFLATVVGGGTVVTPVFYNGTNWVGY